MDLPHFLIPYFMFLIPHFIFLISYFLLIDVNFTPNFQHWHLLKKEENHFLKKSVVSQMMTMPR
jgi:hypothetical protein